MQMIPLLIALPLILAFAMHIFARIKAGLCDLLAVAGTFVLFVLSAILIAMVHGGSTFVYQMGGSASPLGIGLVLDGLSALMLLTISLISFMVSLYSVNYMNKFTDKPKFYTLFMLMIAGMNGVVLAGDIFNMYVFIEVAAISSYALVAFGCEADELEASFKYLVLGSIASSLILLSIIIMYAAVGSVNMASISLIVSKNGVTPPILLCFALFIAGFGLKGAMVPFHAWLPDAHPSAPAPISAMLSGLLIKAIGVYALARIIFNIFGMTGAFSGALMFFGALSMLLGGVLAVGQTDFKRLLAYSSVSQMGYIFLGLGIASPLGILGAVFHIFNHAAFKSLLFLNSGAVEYATGTRDMNKMGGLKDKMPVTFLTSLAASMAIGGMPPFNGFWSKLIIILAAVRSGHILFAAAAALASIFTLAALLKAQKQVFFGRINEGFAKVKEAPLLMLSSMVIMAFICIAAGLAFPYVIYYIIKPAASVLLSGSGYARMVIGGQ